MASKLQLRRDFAAEWVSVNPILAEGEPGIELDTNKFKLGNGISAWNALPYSTTDTTAITAAINDEILRATTAEGLLAPKSTTYTKTEVDTALSGKASAITNTGDETTATIKSKLGITTLSGSNTGDQTTITGNAGTATTLQNARTINGVSFDGSTNITINAVDSTARVATSAVGAASGVVPLGSDSKIAATYLPSYVDDVLEFANLAGFPTTGEAGKIYVALDTNKTYRWGGSSYTYITSGAIDSISVTAPISSTGGATPTIGINAATTSTDGSMSAADKTKLDAVNTSALVKTGGTVGQVLTKVDNIDFNTQWTTPTAGGTIDSVVAPLTYNSTTKQLSTDGTVVINGGTTPVGFGGVASATAEVAITEVGLANSGSLAGSALGIAQTWATTGNPTAIKLNVTNSQSGSAAKLMDLQVGGSSKFSVDKNGSVRVVEGSYPATTNLFGTSTNGIGIYSNIVTVIANNTQAAWVSGSTLTILPTMAYSWANNGVAAYDLALWRDAANTLAQRNGINPQSSRLYRNYTDASNVAYSDSKQDATTGLIVNAVNTGTLAEPTNMVDYQLNGVSKFSISKSGVISNSSSYPSAINFAPASSVGVIDIQTGNPGFAPGTAIQASFQSYYYGTEGLNLVGGINFSTRQSRLVLNSPNASLINESTGVVAQRNSTNAQTFRLYNTYTDASNYERSALSFATYSGALYTKLAAESAGTGAANIGIALSPKGTGAITAQVPDGTIAGGNARGANSVDLQTVRAVNDQVASGNNSIILGGGSCIASGAASIAIGQVARATSQSSIAMGYGTGASGIRAVAIGGGTSQDSLLASGNYSVVLGGYNNIASSQMSIAFGEFAISNKFGQVATGITSFSASADCQYSYLGFAGATTNATTTEIFLKNSSPNRATIPNSTTWAADIDIVARSSGGTENAYFKRRLVIQKGTTAASTALIGTVQTVGTDIGTTNMLAIATPITLTADTTNGAMKLEVTGIAATNIRWVAKVSLVEVGYA